MLDMKASVMRLDNDDLDSMCGIQHQGCASGKESDSAFKLTSYLG